MICPKCRRLGNLGGEMYGSVVDKLLEVKKAADGKKSLFSSQGQGMSGYEELAAYRAILEELE